MEPYVPCWCLSGKKFKFCHFRREREQKVNFFELEAQMNAALRQGYCSVSGRVDDPCSGKIAKAHTVQRRGSCHGLEPPHQAVIGAINGAMSRTKSILLHIFNILL